MEIGAWVGNNGPASTEHMVGVARAADRTGLASVWAADHLLWPVEYESKYPYGGDKYPSTYDQPVCECVTTMTWLSAHTTRVKVGSLVIVVPQRNPWILARQLATLDYMNGGRTILGAGIGWLREEFEALGMSFEARGARTEEAFRLMRAQSPQGGRIINNGSVSAYVPRPGSVPYTSTKHAITGMTRTLSLDGRPFNIACGQIDIGNALTDMAKPMTVGVPQADGSVRAEATMDVEDIARSVLYMASLPLEANVQFMTVMATTMPYVGRG